MTQQLRFWIHDLMTFWTCQQADWYLCTLAEAHEFFSWLTEATQIDSKSGVFRRKLNVYQGDPRFVGLPRAQTLNDIPSGYLT